MSIIPGRLLVLVVTWVVVVVALSVAMLDVIEENRAIEREIAEQYADLRSELKGRIGGARQIHPSMHVSVVVRRER